MTKEKSKRKEREEGRKKERTKIKDHALKCQVDAVIEQGMA